MHIMFYNVIPIKIADTRIKLSGVNFLENKSSWFASNSREIKLQSFEKIYSQDILRFQTYARVQFTMLYILLFQRLLIFMQKLDGILAYVARNSIA